MNNKLQPALLMQATHLVLSSVWNSYGVALIKMEQVPLGPTASLSIAGLMIIFLVLILLGARHFKPLYLVCTLIIIYGAGNAIIPAFTADPNLWPSDFWRLAGAGLNCIGVIGGVLGVFLCLKK